MDDATQPGAELKTTDILELLGSLDEGTVFASLQDDLGEIIAALRKRVGEAGGTAKAKLTISLAFTFDGKLIEIKPDVSTTLPRPVHGKGVFWPTKDNKLSPQNPKQLELGGIRDVSTTAPRNLRKVD